MRKILILGGSGFVGSAIMKQLSGRYDVYATYCHNSVGMNDIKSIKFDVQKPESVIVILEELRPDIIISCLRGDFNNQLSVHEKAAEFLKVNGGMMYFFSTANVFDADLSRLHNEEDIPNSCTDYGRYKIKCEEKLQEILGENVCIIRIPQVWGKSSPRIKNLIELNKDKKILEIYPELEISTITDLMIARQLEYIIDNKLNGIFNLTPEGTIKYNDLLIRIIKGLKLDNIKINNDYSEKGCFALLSRRMAEFPDELKYTNEDVIKSIINTIE